MTTRNKVNSTLTIAMAALILSTPIQAAASDEASDTTGLSETSGRTSDNEVILETQTYQQVSPPAASSGQDTTGSSGNSAGEPDPGPIVAYADQTTQQPTTPGDCTIREPSDDELHPTSSCTPIPQDDQNDAPTTDTPAQPAQPLTITAHDIASTIANGSGITRQPPGPTVLITKPLIVYTNPTPPQNLTTTIANTPIDIQATPLTTTWAWGDGTTTTTTDPGAPYPHHTITHHYTHTATNITTTLTTTWTATWRPTGTTQWHTVNGTLTTTETTTPYNITRTITYLTDDAEQTQHH